MSVLTGLHVKNGSDSSDLVREAAEDAYTRLVFPSIEREIRNELTDRASTESIKVLQEIQQSFRCSHPLREELR